MKKGLLSVLLAAVMVAGVFGAVPVGAQEAPEAPPEVPEEPNIVDPAGDANYLNDGNIPGSGKNNETGDDVGSASDIMAVWFDASEGFLNAYVQTEAPITADTVPYFFQIYVDPGAGDDCMTLQGSNGQSGRVDPSASLSLSGDCGAETLSEGAEILFQEGPDGTGIMTLRFPQSMHDALADGGQLVTPSARVTHYTYMGDLGVPNPLSGGTIGGVTAPAADNTEVGTDYLITSDDDGSDAVKKKKKKPLTKKACKKIKNKRKQKACLKKLKKKKKKKSPTVEACEAYVPGEQGAEAETVIVTDEHTEEAPLELTIEQEPGMANDQGLGEFATGSSIYDGTAKSFNNFQVDSEADEVGLYIRYEFPIYEDHDLWVRYPDGSQAARAAGFNQTSPGPLDDNGAGGHTEQGAEQIDGLRIADCVGYTLEFSNFLGIGGEYTVKAWFGEIQNDPAEPEGGGAAALALMQETLSR
jgi:hypothetical protein